MLHTEEAMDDRGHFKYEHFWMSLNLSFANVQDLLLHMIHKQNPQVIKGLKLKNQGGLEPTESWQQAGPVSQKSSKSKETIFILFIPISIISLKRLVPSIKSLKISKIIKPPRQEWKGVTEKEE